MSQIQALNEAKTKIHKDKYLKKYPYGTFSIQIRDIPTYGDNAQGLPSNKREGWRQVVYLRWGTKIGRDPFSTHYYVDGFTLSSDGRFVHGINNSFGTVKYFSTLEDMLKKMKQLGITYEPTKSFVTLYSKYSTVPVKRTNEGYIAHYPKQ